jgi:GGDEF domain-containing protein
MDTQITFPATAASTSGFRADLATTLRAFRTWACALAGGSVNRVCNRRELKVRGDRLLREAFSQRRPISMVVFGFDDLVEAAELYDAATFRKAHARVLRHLQALAGPRGIAAHTGDGEFTVMLPGCNREQARGAIERVMGWPACIEINLPGDEILLVPRVEFECAGPDVDCARDFYQELHLELDDARRYEVRRLRHLTLERERHTRPAGLAAA